MANFDIRNAKCSDEKDRHVIEMLAFAMVVLGLPSRSLQFSAFIETLRQEILNCIEECDGTLYASHYPETPLSLN